eukprot:3101064-Prymnesium_polylepis.1
MRCGPGTARGSLRHSSALPPGMLYSAGRAHVRAVRRRERALTTPHQDGRRGRPCGCLLYTSPSPRDAHES